MSGLLGVDGWPYRWLSRWYELIILGLVWLLLALPLITAPVATAWLLDGVRRTADGQAIRGPRDTVGFVRRRFVDSWRLAGIHLGVATLVIIALAGPSPGGAWGGVVFVVAAAVGLTWAMLAPWSVVAHLDRPWREALRTAYLRALRHWPLAVLSATAVALGPLASAYAPDVVGLIVVISAPGLIAAAVLRLYDHAAPIVTRSTVGCSAGTQAHPPSAPITRGPVMEDISISTGATS